MKHALVLVLLLSVCYDCAPGQDRNRIENKVFEAEFSEVWDAMTQLLLRHQWRFDVLEKSSGVIRTKPYAFSNNDGEYSIYVRTLLTIVDRGRTNVHISFQFEKEYRDAFDSKLRIGKFSIVQKIHQYFAELDSVLEWSRNRSLDRQDDRKEILAILEKYVAAEQSHDVQGQLRWFRFPYTFGRENKQFVTVNEREFEEILTQKARRFQGRYGKGNGIISLFNRSVKFFGDTFALSSFDWEYFLPDGEIRYGRDNTFFSKQDSSWKILMQYDVDQ